MVEQKAEKVQIPDVGTCHISPELPFSRLHSCEKEKNSPFISYYP